MTDRPFVAWDGEGATVRGRHRYTLFASSTGVDVADGRGLPPFAALRALCVGAAEYPGTHVGFAIGYDSNLMLRGLTRAQLERVWDGGRVRFKDPLARGRWFTVQYRPRKYLWARYEWNGRESSVTWWDVWPFFQSSFVVALEKYKVGTATDLVWLRHMKAERAAFTASRAKEVREYNRLELTLLVELCENLRASFASAGFFPGRWDGPGAVAAALLRKNGAKGAGGDPPTAVLDAAQHAYYGGRIECARYGERRGPVYQYDLNSAYPAAMLALPCRRETCGRWERADRFSWRATVGFSVHRVVWNFPRGARFYPFPWRSHRGGVFFPPAGEGWVWAPELLTVPPSQRDYVTVVDSWRWWPRCRHKGPFAWVADAYRERLAARKRGDAAEHAFKLGLNSLYGKLAQRVGARMERTGRWRTPPFHDLAAAGFVTSSVRAKVYRAAAADPDAIVMLATDGVFATRPLDLPTRRDKRLGAWERTDWAGATVVQSGVYWLDAAASGETEGSTVEHCRGFDVESLDRDGVRRAWAAGESEYRATLSRFNGMGLALAQDLKKWNTWTTEPRRLALHPFGTKREPELYDGTSRAYQVAYALRGTWPASVARFWADPHGNGRMTTPSALPWRDAGGAESDTDDGRALDRALAESEDAGL